MTDWLQLQQHWPWAMAFAAVMQHGSFTKAAQALGVSKALLSKQIQQLEHALGTQLLYRTTRRLHLTEAGKLYLAHCQDWQARLQAAQLELAEQRQTIAGHLRITVPTSFGGVFMAKALLAFRAQYSLLSIELDLSTVPRDLEAEGYDLAIRANLPPPERLICRPLAMVHDWLVATPECLAAQPPLAQVADLAQVPCLLNSHFAQAQVWEMTRDGQLFSVTVSAPFQANDYALIRNFALLGAGVARLPGYLVAGDVAAGRLIRVLPEYQLRGLPMYMIYPQRLPQPAKVKALVDFLAHWFAAPEQSQMLN
ncbi:LysR family transcriptional regulator [Chitinibacter sp. SCUT-21]|uniref:LysR family transcriptional regulator n=1 Tax=Chitinibacter sp. SCUT-21 TaxID=2970891 RepID=UPI0035A59922